MKAAQKLRLKLLNHATHFRQWAGLDCDMVKITIPRRWFSRITSDNAMEVEMLVRDFHKALFDLLGERG